MVSAEDEGEGEVDPASSPPPCKDAVCYIKSSTSLHSIQCTGQMISWQNIQILGWHNHFLISWEPSLLHFKLSSHRLHYLETNCSARPGVSYPWLGAGCDVNLVIPSWSGQWWPVVAPTSPAPLCGEDKKLWLTPPSSLLVSPGESELWPRDGSDCPTKTDRRSQWSCCNVKCFMWRKSDPPARASWRVNYSWNGLLEQILFSRVVAGADEPGLQCDYLQSKPDNCWLEGNEKLILLEFCWKKFR